MKYDENLKLIVNLIDCIKTKNNVNLENLNYIVIDPSITTLGYSIVNLKKFILIETGVLKYKKYLEYNDDRLLLIHNDIEKLILIYNPIFAVLENVSYSVGRYSYAEATLNKAVGAIIYTFIKNNLSILHLSNLIAKRKLLEISTKLNLNFNYSLRNDSNKKNLKLLIDLVIFSNNSNKVKYQKDVYDSIMLAYCSFLDINLLI